MCVSRPWIITTKPLYVLCTLLCVRRSSFVCFFFFFFFFRCQKKKKKNPRAFWFETDAEIPVGVFFFLKKRRRNVTVTLRRQRRCRRPLTWLEINSIRLSWEESWRATITTTSSSLIWWPHCHVEMLTLSLRNGHEERVAIGSWSSHLFPFISTSSFLAT